MTGIGNQAQILKYRLLVAERRQVDDPLKLAHAVRHLGDAYRRAGKAALAEPCYLEALSIYRDREDSPPLDLANAVRGFAVLKQETGALAEAEELWREAHDLYLAVEVLAGVAGSSASLALIAKEQGKLQQSRDWLDQAITNADRAGDAEVQEHVQMIEAQLKSSLTG
jgi:tetratricopeptide (TPR) repeat protein